ncbi:hypothetical protein LTR85_009942 [Meristemomyces frigidus]|nr:hypothetical protein LTR85_009942 [Meristemomyces frigidus]
MDHSARKRRRDALRPAIPPTPIFRDERTRQGKLRRPASGKIRTAKDSNEITRVPRRTQPLDRPSTDEDPNARQYTVANVGAGGTLYLKPSRMPPPNYMQRPATPPKTSDGGGNGRTEWSNERQSNVSGSWTLRVQAARAGAYENAVPMPPLSLANGQPKRRPRSHSFSTVSDHVRSSTFDSNDFQLLVNGKDAEQRPKSSIDLSGGFLDLHIPHYRLGTPRFSDRGTAYLHSSMYTSTTTDDMRSSVFSRADYDKLFPAPPGRPHGSVATTRSTPSPYLHPSVARNSPTPSRTPPIAGSPSSQNGGIPAAVFDKVAANPDDPSIVRYHTITGKITAATPARLIAQITSPLFLDYELLSDFFLTFRSFLSCRDLLEYLLARMRWALGTTTDAGRIVRVRTFVALRHWILNYFVDDFVLDVRFRQRFCDLVNDLVHDLRRRADRGGSDMNIVGEMKKCWRRTCAMYFPANDALDSSPEADIWPGAEQNIQGFAASAASLPLSLHPKTSKADFRRVSAPVQIPAETNVVRDIDAANGNESTMQAFGPEDGMTMRTASIPASPMSEHSLQVLSCSVPFLRHMRHADKAGEKTGTTRPAGLLRNPPLSGRPNKSSHQHKRSGSFSDALRDGRAPLPSSQGQTVDVRSLPAITFTGGLVRGLLLQPSPAKVDLLIPISPGLESRGVRFVGIEENYFDDKSGQTLGVKRFVGDVRRALSSRKGRHESPTRSSHRSTNSSDSRSSANLVPVEQTKPSHPSAWQQLRGPPRVDLLGARIGDSYKSAFHDADLPDPADEEAHQRLVADRQRQRESDIQPDEPDMSPPRPNVERWNSHVTVGDRSILIVDDTGSHEPPMISGALPSVSSMSSAMTPQPLFGRPEEGSMDVEQQQYGPGTRTLRQSVSYGGERMYRRPSSDIPMHDLLAVPESWRTGQAEAQDVNSSPTAQAAARKSSSAQPSGLQMPQIAHQLRRRPGGDLKAADHVHELEPLPRPDTMGSFSTISHSQGNSGVPSRELSGTHFSGQDFASWRMPLHVVSDRGQNSVGLLDWDSSQPELRPSFQAEVSTLANIPDRSHVGGIEETLMKLEGKAPTPTDSTITATDTELPTVARHAAGHGPLRVTNLSLSADGSTSVEGDNIRSPRTETQGASIYHLSGSDETDNYKLQSIGSSEPYGRSEAQDSAAPVLPKPSKADMIALHGLRSTASDKSVAFVARPSTPSEAGKGDRATKSDGAPRSGTSQGSFLLDDNESLSDISTEMADQSEEDGLGVRSFFFDDTVDDDNILPQSFRAPPTPPSTVGAPQEDSPERDIGRTDVPNEAAPHLKEAQSAPKLLSPNFDRSRAQQQPLPSADLRRVKTAPGAQTAAHLPFLLAFESETVAEQLTIIEKDALDEVDWKDLIALNWQQSPPHVRNWVEFLKADNCTGVDIVVARFNLVVKWVVSECLLTEAPSERARCITKFIHVATHCRRFRNYASMYQITLGLLSADLARLHMTWALVAPAEKQMLDRLEKLCQPVRNFGNLRQEMEASTVDSGCIPFIGLYTHDLMFNAQKPSRIDITPLGKEPLINFERYQTAATIVKSLLRLIEASSKYIFHPHPEVLSRCLWLAALEDAEINSRSKTLEQ